MTENPPETKGPKCYVRVTGTRDQKFVEFDFAIGDPDLCIEMILPFVAFREFCACHQVLYLTAEQAAETDFNRLKWRYGAPGIAE